MYIYIETSSPRQPGDTARLESPWMRGPQCMTFYYHMYGSTMSRLVIYIKSQATNKSIWSRSQDQGDHWIQAQISINETSSYQVSRKYQFTAFNSISVSLSTCIHESRTATGSELFSIPHCPYITFTLLRIFFPLEMSSIKIWEITRSQRATCSLPVAVRV